MLEKNQIGIALNNFTINQDFEIEAEISQIDYLSIVNHFLPIIRKKDA